MPPKMTDMIELTRLNSILSSGLTFHIVLMAYIGYQVLHDLIRVDLFVYHKNKRKNEIMTS